MNVIKQYVINILNNYYFLKFRSDWRNKNAHNYTNAGCIFPVAAVNVGNLTYGTLNVISYGNKDERLNIGNCCSIAGNVKFILSGEHDYSRISTYPFRKIIMNGESESITKGPIIVGDDVWIGYGCIILSGVSVGRGAIIGAGSVVTKNIPPYSVFAGDRVIRYRYTEQHISIAEKVDYGKMNKEFIKNNIDLLESNDVNDFRILLHKISKND